MNLQHVEHCLAYGSIGLYGLVVLGFWLFALSLLKNGFKHFALCVLAGVFWPAFITFALVRQKKVNAQPPKYVEIKRRK